MIQYWDELKWWGTDFASDVNLQLQNREILPDNPYYWMDYLEPYEIKKVSLGKNPRNKIQPYKGFLLDIPTPMTYGGKGYDHNRMWREFYREVLGELGQNKDIIFHIYGNMGKRYRRFLPLDAKIMEYKLI